MKMKIVLTFLVVLSLTQVTLAFRANRRVVRQFPDLFSIPIEVIGQIQSRLPGLAKLSQESDSVVKPLEAIQGVAEDLKDQGGDALDKIADSVS